VGTRASGEGEPYSQDANVTDAAMVRLKWCATRRNDVMRGNLHRLYRQAMSPWGVALHEAMQGEIAAPERYR
jgi:hypothetical protein